MEHLWLQGSEIFAGCTHGGIIDLSNAFYHFDIAEDSKEYLGFECFWKFYCYNSIQQGIHSGTFIFTIFTEVTNLSLTPGVCLVFGFSITRYFPMGAVNYLMCSLHTAFVLEHLISLCWLVASSLQKLLGYPIPQLFQLWELEFIFQHNPSIWLNQNSRTSLASLIPCSCLWRALSSLWPVLLSHSESLQLHCLGPAASISTSSMYAKIEDLLSAEELQLNQKSTIGWSRHVSWLTEILSTICNIGFSTFVVSIHSNVWDIEADLDTDARGGSLGLCPLSSLSPSWRKLHQLSIVFGCSTSIAFWYDLSGSSFCSSWWTACLW